MRYFPVFLDLQGRLALVVGDGEAADRKAAALRRAGARVIVSGRYDPALLDGVALAIGAEAPDADLHLLSTEAQRRGIPVNVVDRTALCSYITPAVVDRAPLLVAISSAGAAPVLARLIRARIEAMVPPSYGRLAALVDRFKDELRARLPDMRLRRRVLEAALEGRVADLVFAGDEAAAEAEMRHLLATGKSLAGGIVHLVGAGPGAADLLTLRAQRLLGDADVIVHDPRPSSAVLDMARRDARRMPAAGGALLVRLARDGNKVVRLAAAPAPDELAALAEAGVACEVVPGVAEAGTPADDRQRQQDRDA